MLPVAGKQEPIKGKRFPFKTTKVMKQVNRFLVSPHWHEQPEFIQVKSGSVLVTVDKRQFEAQERDIIFVYTGQVHAVQVVSGQPASLEGLIFDNAMMTEIAQSIDTMAYHAAYTNGSSHHNLYRPSHPLWSRLNDSMNESIGEFGAKAIYHETIIQSHLCRMIGLILRHYWQESLPDPESKKRRIEQQFDLLRPALDYIENRLSEPLSLNELGKLVNMSPHYFSRLFKKSMGVTLSEHIMSARIRLAKHLLLTSRLTVTEIADKAGFCDLQYFGKVFKRETGVSPSLYKRGGRSDEG